jgi:hypothetical protein
VVAVVVVAMMMLYCNSKKVFWKGLERKCSLPVGWNKGMMGVVSWGFQNISLLCGLVYGDFCQRVLNFM